MTDQAESVLVPSDSMTVDLGPSYESPTLARLPNDQRPRPTTICESCPGAVWHPAPNDIRCYCQVMHVIVWTKAEPDSLTACDGREMALAAMKQE